MSVFIHSPPSLVAMLPTCSPHDLRMEEHADDERQYPLLDVCRSHVLPCPIPLLGTAPTPHPRLSPPSGEGHPQSPSTPEHPYVPPVVPLRCREAGAWF